MLFGFLLGMYNGTPSFVVTSVILFIFNMTIYIYHIHTKHSNTLSNIITTNGIFISILFNIFSDEINITISSIFAFGTIFYSILYILEK